MFQTKDAILPVFIFYSKEEGGNGKFQGGGGNAESSAVIQTTISVFLSQKNKKYVRTLCP